jgi:hypothetical protein
MFWVFPNRSSRVLFVDLVFVDDEMLVVSNRAGGETDVSDWSLIGGRGNEVGTPRCSRYEAIGFLNFDDSIADERVAAVATFW